MLDIFELAESVTEEAIESDRTYGDFTSSHEGFGVLAEEVTELLEAIHANDEESVRAEALQVAAVALRIAHASQIDAFKIRSGMNL